MPIKAYEYNKAQLFSISIEVHEQNKNSYQIKVVLFRQVEDSIELISSKIRNANDEQVQMDG